MTPSTLYAVWPDRDNPGTVLLVAADEGAAGHAQIAERFPNQIMALNGYELLHAIVSFQQARKFKTWECLMGGGLQILFIVVIDGKPTERIVVQAKSMGEAIKHAHRAFKNATFSPIGALEQYLDLAARIAGLPSIDGDAGEVDLDLRDGSGGVLIMDGMGSLPDELYEFGKTGGGMAFNQMLPIAKDWAAGRDT